MVGAYYESIQVVSMQETPGKRFSRNLFHAKGLHKERPTAPRAFERLVRGCRFATTTAAEFASENHALPASVL